MSQAQATLPLNTPLAKRRAEKPAVSRREALGRFLWKAIEESGRRRAEQALRLGWY